MSAPRSVLTASTWLEAGDQARWVAVSAAANEIQQASASCRCHRVQHSLFSSTFQKIPDEDRVAHPAVMSYKSCNIICSTECPYHEGGLD